MSQCTGSKYPSEIQQITACFSQRQGAVGDKMTKLIYEAARPEYNYVSLCMYYLFAYYVIADVIQLIQLVLCEYKYVTKRHWFGRQL